MASGHYELRWVENAQGALVRVRVWVPDKPAANNKKKAGGQAAGAAAAAAARRRAQAEARRRAAAAAAAAARTRAARDARKRLLDQQAKLAADQRAEGMRADAQRRIAASRRAAYDELQRRQRALLAQSGLIDGRRATQPSRPTPKAPVYKPTREVVYDRMRRDEAERSMAADEAKRQQALRDAEKQKWDEYGYRWRKAKTLTDAKATPAQIEQLLADEAKRAGKGQIDAESVSKLADKYVAYAEGVAVEYKKLVAQINALIDKGNIKAAGALYYGAFGKVAKEYLRLFGDGKHPEKDGAFNKFFADYSAVDQAQRDWWKRQMQAALDSDRASVNDHVHDLSEEIRKANARGEGELAADLAKQQAEFVRLSDVYAGKTSTITYIDENGTHVRKRTIEEELEYRQAQKRIEMERLRAQMDASDRRRDAIAKAEGLAVGANGGLVSRDQDRVQRDMIALVNSKYGGKPPNLTKPGDIQNWADELLKQWELRNPKPQYQLGSADPARSDAWDKARERYEQSIYSFYGQNTPQWWDRLFGLPGVSHGLATLQGGVAAIGAGGRIVLKGTTGSSQLKTFPSVSELPDGIRQQVEEAEQKYKGPTGPGGAPLTLNFVGQGLGKVSGVKLLDDWIKTPEGAAWLAAWTKKNQKRMSEEDLAFLKGFYGEGDIGSKLQSLIDYGTTPVGDPAGDLMFQLLADPTNAIPLKFTTYLARAKFAAQQSGKYGNAATKVAGGVRDFVKIDEGSLRLRKELDRLLKESQVSGKTARQLTDEILLDVGGIANRSAREEAIRARLIQAGVLKRLVDDTQIFNLIEKEAKDMIAARAVTYDSQSEIAKRLKAANAQAKAAATQARRVKQQAREKQLAAGRKVREQTAVKARTDIHKVRLADARKKANNPQLSDTEQAIYKATGLSEEQFWAKAQARAKAVLHNPRASLAAKRAARKRLSDLSRAAEAKRAAQKGGNFVHWRERARAERRVLKLHGKDAESLVAPKLIAPLVDDAVGLTVEKARTFWRSLRAASPNRARGGVTRLGAKRTEDFFPPDLWEKVHREVTEAIELARGFKGDLRTTGRRQTQLQSSVPMTRLTDKDPVVIKAKKAVLDKYGISIPAYDEARKVLRRGQVQGQAGEWLLAESKRVAPTTGETPREAFLRLRTEEAAREGQRQLGAMAYGEMFGHAPDDIMEEFLARYTDDGLLKKTALELTDFQRKTLEEYVKKLSGVGDINDVDSIHTFLGSRGKPPLKNREEAREFLIETGAWSPRVASQFTDGARSWSVAEEAEFWLTNYGEVPEWARVADLKGQKNVIFHDQDMYVSQNREWGIFNRDAEAKLRLSGDTIAEIENRIINGDPITGVKGKRELDLQRRYLVERYGDLVGHHVDPNDPDKGVVLTSMPWMMYPDELKGYFNTQSATRLAPQLIQNAGELDEVVSLIRQELDRYFDEHIMVKAQTGPIEYGDIFRLSSRIQSRLLADPKWAHRTRDGAGTMLNAWATVNRAMVFTQISFLSANVVDMPIKSAWYRYTRRALFNANLAAIPVDVAEWFAKWQPHDLGIDVQSTLYQMKGQRPLKDIWKDPLNSGLRGVIEKYTVLPKGLFRAAPANAAKVEVIAKMNLARGMAPEVYAQALKKLGDADLADAFTRRFVKQEINRMWPTAGDHPLEKLFNQLVPFGSYMVKNKVLFISEAAAHPSILNQIEFVGQYIEKTNRAAWEEKHPGEPLPDWAARRIELPWAPGYFLDLGQFSDATRGLKPIYNAAKGPTSYKDFVAQWIRLVNPSTQAGIYMLTNALGVTQKVAWRPVLNEDGFVTGYEKVITGWTEPWSQDQPDWGSVVWVLDVIESAQKSGLDGNWTNGEMAVLLGKLTMFDAIQQVDRGYGLYEYYKAFRLKDKASAEKWLESSPDGEFLQDWLRSKSTGLRDAKFSQLQLDMNAIKDPAKWWHSASPAFQNRVKEGRLQIDRITAAFDEKLYGLQPGTNAYKEAKADMFFFISEVYRQYPELMMSEVYGKDALEWSRQLLKWETGKLTDEFFALDAQRPSRGNYDTVAAYNKALDAWRHQKEIFLATYPQVASGLNDSRDAYHRVKDQVDKEWDEVLNRIGKRNEAIEAAKLAGEREKADLLYLQNELDFSILEQDHVAMYWTDDDFNKLPKGIAGPPSLRDSALKKATTLLDFDAIRYQKALREGRGAEFLADAFYANGLKEVILKAKGGNVFGKFNPGVFVNELKKRPKLLAMYYDKNPGKQQQWAKSDEYIKWISGWGQAARRGDWDTAERLWNKLPQWVKDRYYAKHPEKRGKAIQSAEYRGWLGRWVAYFEKDDVKGGMEFFWKMPKWVREKYFAKHPEKRAKWEAQMKFGAQLSEYFAADGKEAQAAYLAGHKDLQAWLAKNVTSEEARRQSIIAAYRAIPKDEQWLRRIYREKFPEVFSQEALGERKLKKVYDRLAQHPELLPEFEKWVKAIWDSYTLMVRHGKVPPRPLKFGRAKRLKSHRSAEQTSEANSH